MKILGIIPSRYASTRFPGKPLVDIEGKTMIQRVYEQCIKAKSLAAVVVATDDSRIYDHVNDFGGKAVMTSEAHPSGTDRCFEALQKTGEDFDYVINIQGDEPFIQPEQIDTLAGILDGQTELATLVMPTISTPHILSPNEAKVVFDKNMNALYFSREPIPHLRDVNREDWGNQAAHHVQIGMYGYRVDILEAITSLDKSSLEKAESLEQLRWLENGYKIKLALTDTPSFGVDTPEDLEALKKQFLG